MKFTLLALASAAPALALFNYTIAVGKDEVENNDLIIFQFYGGTHRVIQSSFGSPCSSNGGFDSQQIVTPNGTVGVSRSFTVTNISTPLFFYDEADQNCLRGAVFCANTNEAGGSTQTCNLYKAAALAQGAAQGVTTSVRSNTPYSQSTASSASRTSSSARLTATSASASASATQSKSAAVGGVGASWLAGLVGLVAAVGVVA
ncbi:hypothetical protein RQP46_001505 [Phenoliferia psychrophenolica]